MSEKMLHILAPSRFDSVAAVVGDSTALLQFRNAIDDALKTNTGGTFLCQSDGEGYSLAVVCVDSMYNVCTTYAGEASLVRSLRETVALRAVPHFLSALGKANAAQPPVFEIPRFIRAQKAVTA